MRGPRAWELARQLFRPAGKPVPEAPEVNRFWFGTLGSDEVVLARTASDTIEVHCHGGRRVVRWVTEQFLTNGCLERAAHTQNEGHDLLQRAPTLRTASIILDQLNGAFAREVRRILALLETDPPAAYQSLQQLTELGSTIGAHLIAPWPVVVSGPPNVGKSSLVNAIVGYQRSVVSATAGTTRDTVTARTAFDGWPVELTDTAGFREALGLEAEGIELAARAREAADVVLWVLDLTDPAPVLPSYPDNYLPVQEVVIFVANKCDQPQKWSPNTVGAIPVSAVTGEGIPKLIQLISRYLVTDCPPSIAVPYSPRLIDLISRSYAVSFFGDWSETARLLHEALAEAESHHFASPLGLSSKP